VEEREAMDVNRLVESVPNFSEGRRAEVVDDIVAAFAGAHPDVLVLDRSSDPDHNRSVLTLAGPPSALAQAAVAGARACARLIDLTRHRGAHPRMGALDVLPFVPLGATTEDDCIALAGQVGRRLAEEAGIPVYFYGAAARAHQPAAGARQGLRGAARAGDRRPGARARPRRPGAAPDRRRDRGRGAALPDRLQR
jgi:glutamate formiminotransferase